MPESTVAINELVVPKSMPTMSLIAASLKFTVQRSKKFATLLPPLAHEGKPAVRSPSPPHTCGGEGRGEEVFHPLNRAFVSQPWCGPVARHRAKRFIMKCIVTAGPAYEELDGVRRLTNFSTGALGTGLADYLSGLGHEVELLIGYYSTCDPAVKAQRQQTFTTTADLRRRLAALASPDVGAVFHAAAVSDFTFGRIWERTPTGELREIKAAKIPTRAEGLLAELQPTPKIIRELRGWFPKAFLIGWKYELEPAGEGGAVARGADQ